MAPRLLSHLLLMLALLAVAAPTRAQALWLEAGRPSAAARQAVDALLAAAGEGLDPRDYDAARLDDRLRRALTGPASDDVAGAQLDEALTAALQRYLADLRGGRVDPRRIHANFRVPRPTPLDARAYLRDAVARGRVAEALRQAGPHVPMYTGLRKALAYYRALSGHPAWQAELPPLPARKLVPGQPWDGLPLLTQRLQAVGDLPASISEPVRLEGALLAALLAFQERHGLAPDGILGAATLAQLDVTPKARARQIELAMERLRWTPLLQGPRMVVVNVPEFMLRAYEVREGRVEVSLTMKVIVGKAMDTRTPLFDELLRAIEFSPYWNVPPSIARAEIVPRLRRDPAYFAQQGFEFVTSGGQIVTALSGAHLDAVLEGGWRIRQRPGPNNALGDIKFVFPNRNNIYLHHTPATRLFDRERRDLSHGCIRVESPVALARFVLSDEPEWTDQRIRDAMGQGESGTLRLKQPLPVLIAYSTVVVKGSRVFFLSDLYGHDRLLDQALRERSGVLGRIRPAPPGVP